MADRRYPTPVPLSLISQKKILISCERRVGSSPFLSLRSLLPDDCGGRGSDGDGNVAGGTTWRQGTLPSLMRGVLPRFSLYAVATRRRIGQWNDMVRARRWQRPSSTYLSTSGGLLSGKISHLVFLPLSSMNFSIFRVRVLDFLETGQRKRKKTRKGDERKEGSLHTEGGDGVDLLSGTTYFLFTFSCALPFLVSFCSIFCNRADSQ